MKLKSPFLNRKPRMELISLMDVMFLVLVFFIYSIFSMSVHRGVKVELPDGTGSLQKGELVVITICKDGALQLNGRPVDSSAGLRRELSRLKSFPGKIPVVVSGDRASPLGKGIEVLSALESIGADKISFQVTGSIPADSVGGGK